MFLKLIAYVASILLITSCSMEWAEKVRPDDYDRVSVYYKRMKPAPALNNLGLKQCIQVEGIPPEAQKKILNSKGFFEFDLCKKSPIILTYKHHTEGELKINGKGMEMKNAIKSSGGGNTLLGFLLLSSISTTTVSAKAKGTFVMNSNGQNFTTPFETGDVYVSTDDLSNLETAIVQLTENYIREKIEPRVEEKKYDLKFEAEKEYYHLFRWDIHYDRYEMAHKNLAKVMTDHPDQGDVYFNRGLVYEIQRKHELALKDYEQALKLGFEKAAAYRERLKSEIDYLISMDKINPNLRKELTTGNEPRSFID